MKNQFLPIILLLLFNCSNRQPVQITESQTMTLTEQCDCEGFVDWRIDLKIPVYDRPEGQIIDTVSHDISSEDFLTFKLSDSQGEYFQVEIGRAISGTRISGWIKKSENLGTYARNYSASDTLYLRSGPDEQLNALDSISSYHSNMYQIVDCSGQWLKVKMTSDVKTYEGWMEPDMQCPNPYTTCN